MPISAFSLTPDARFNSMQSRWCSFTSVPQWQHQYNCNIPGKLCTNLIFFFCFQNQNPSVATIFVHGPAGKICVWCVSAGVWLEAARAGQQLAVGLNGGFEHIEREKQRRLREWYVWIIATSRGGNMPSCSNTGTTVKMYSPANIRRQSGSIAAFCWNISTLRGNKKKLK